MSAEDQLEILRVLSLYCHVADGRDGEGLAEVFAEDGVMAPATVVAPRRGLAEIREYFTQTVPAQPKPTIAHLALDSVIDLNEDGRSAKVRSKGIGIRSDFGLVLVEYSDEFAKTAQGWRIKHRQVKRLSRFSTELPAE
jgi:hypothetical protein